MAEPLSITGDGVARCYPFFYSFQKCMYKEDTRSDREVKCNPIRADYFECLNGLKEVQRNADIYEVKQLKRSGQWDPHHFHSRVSTHERFNHAKAYPEKAAAADAEE